ncbi:cysteine hydrolase family protein [Rossellomorea aquimaris]|uniref:cysteine hydrolase family protein n=1 Tax=Rossellomorea aquimaris TaxID=189382 RepID=UPI001CFD3B45|nr:cysteine hydrolase family protein [Rossellomorea aquimaris]
MKRALLIIDVQETFTQPQWGKRNNPFAEDNIKELLDEFRKKEEEIIFIKHVSTNPLSGLHPNHEGSAIKEIVKPLETETVMTKRVNSAFIGTTLESHLHERGIKEVVITGLTTPHCVSTTTRMSGNLGFTTYLIEDATAAFGIHYKGTFIDAENVHTVSLATVHDEFATVITTREYLRQL